MILTLERRHFWILAAIFVGLVLVFIFSRRQPHFVSPVQVWQAAQQEGAAHGIDPRLILAIAMAESSFNAHADSGQARGLMQLSPAAWSDSTERPYHDAFDWRVNLSVATRFLAHLQQRLEQRGQLDQVRLAAAYRHGFGALAAVDFDVNRLPAPRNHIYRQLFAGHLPPPEELGVPPPATRNTSGS